MAVVATTTTAIQSETSLVRRHIKAGDELQLEFRGHAYARIVPLDRYAEIVERAERAAELEARLAELEAQQAQEAVPA